MVFYCEQTAGFSNDVGLQDEGYFDALVRMFEQALKVSEGLPPTLRNSLHQRLDAVRRCGRRSPGSSGGLTINGRVRA